jgi:hypothetical protein
MDLLGAIEILKKLVKNAGTIDQKHLDLTLIPSAERSLYEKALIKTQLAVKNGELTRDELLGKLHLL